MTVETGDEDRKPTGKPRFQIEDTRAKETRTAVIVPVISGRAARRVGDAGGRAVGEQRSLGARREEAVGLAAAISLDVVFVELLTLQAPRPATLLGVGKVEEIAHRVADQDVELVVVDHELTPIQQRNLERALKAKVVDRTGLILEIFGRRAQTREGTLQVDLAHLSYQKSRLVRSWTHLERQRGGKGFLGGPGETQIEADRRDPRKDHAFEGPVGRGQTHADAAPVAPSGRSGADGRLGRLHKRWQIHPFQSDRR